MSLGLTTISEEIAEVLETRLRALIRNSTYNTNVTSVIRPRRLESRTIQDRQIVIIEGAHDRVPELDHEGNPPAEAWRLVFNIYCHVKNDERKCEAIDKICKTFAADVKKAVCSVDSRWYTFGENAIDAVWQSTEPISAQGGFDGVNTPIAITYRVSEDDPYEVRA